MATSERPNFWRIILVARYAAVHSLVNPFCVVCMVKRTLLDFYKGGLLQTVIVSGDDVINRRLFTATQLNPRITWTIFARVLK